MKWPWKYGLPAVMFLFIIPAALCQDKEAEEKQFEDGTILKTSLVTIRDIRLTGNKITKNYIVLREVPLKKGEKYPLSEIQGNLQLARQNLMNTTLFVDVSVDFTNWFNDSIDLVIDVKERWYYFPVPYFKPVDRNWNVWINQYNVSFDRVNYGLKFIGNNVTGRNDKMNLYLINGYTRQLSLNYTRPYVDMELKHGYIVDVSYSSNREVNYNTIQNQQAFYKNEKSFVRERLAIGGGYTYRVGSIARHTLRLGYVAESVVDTVARLNPKYFGDGKRKQKFPEFKYTYEYFKVDYIPYPLKGLKWDFNFFKRGISGNIDLWQLSGSFSKYWDVTPKMFLTLSGEANIKFPFDQPFYNQSYLGYGDSYLRGLEYYVIDGVAGATVKGTFRRELASFKWKTGLKSRTYGRIPFRIYAKAYADAGYVYNKNNQLNNSLTNKFLYTGGVGLDIITIYDFVLRLEYSFNQLGERALYYHSKDR
jgi:outer membrane protein assembly factor BamA